MSFNSKDNNSIITQENFEEYFLLYIDNELTADERVAVERYLVQHPELQTDMNLLMASKLPMEEINLTNKEVLLAESMRLNALDESLLLYIDGELNKEETKWLEDKIQKDSLLSLQHQLLLKTKLDAKERIVYPYKEELYRHEKHRRLPIYWMRVAATIIITIGIGALVYTYQSKPSVAVAVTQPKDKKPNIKQHNSGVGVVTEVAQTDLKETKKGISPLSINDVNNATRTMVKQKHLKPIKAKTIMKPEMQENIIATTLENISIQNTIAATPATGLPKQIFNNIPVTSITTNAYNNQEASPTPAVIKDVLAQADNEKKSSLKGLLRKATRFIERRTNISATNENDELLIGAVAFKL